MTDITNDPFLSPRKERLVQADGQNMYTPKAGFWDQALAGFGEGQKYTSYSLISDLGLKFSAVNPIDTISREDWNESHPYYFSDVPWDESLTIDVARNIFFTRADGENYQKLVERGGGGGMFTRGTGIFFGAAIDPINLVAAPAAAYAKAGLGLKMAYAGAANFVVESALQGVAYGTQDVRDPGGLSKSDVAINLGFATLLGGMFPLIGRGIGAGWNKANEWVGYTRSGKLDTDTKIDIDYTPKQKSKIKIKTGHAEVSKYSTITTTNFSTIDSIKIDTAGRINSDDAKVEVTRDGNTISIAGSSQDLAKILPTLASRLDGFEGISIKVDKKPAIVLRTIDEVNELTAKIQKDTNVKGELDKIDLTYDKIEFQNNNYEIEYDDFNNATGRVFRARKDGKRGKQLNDDDAKAIIEANQESALSYRNSINEKAEPIGQEVNLRTNRSGSETIDSKLKNKKNYSTQNEVDASVSGQSRDFIENYGSTETANKAWTAESVISSKNLFRGGYFINESNELIDLTTTKISSLTSRERELLGKRLGVKRTEIPVDENGYAKIDARGNELRTIIKNFDDDMRANHQHKESLKDYVFCRLTAGTL